jgi:hypothetical protein
VKPGQTDFTSQPLYVAHRRLSEESLVFAVEVRRIVVPHLISSSRGIHIAGEKKPMSLLQTHLPLKLQRARR